MQIIYHLLTLKHFWSIPASYLKKKKKSPKRHMDYIFALLDLHVAIQATFKPYFGCQEADFHSVTQSITLASFPLAAYWVWPLGRIIWRPEDRNKGVLGCLSLTMFPPSFWKWQHWATWDHRLWSLRTSLPHLQLSPDWEEFTPLATSGRGLIRVLPIFSGLECLTFINNPIIKLSSNAPLRCHLLLIGTLTDSVF